jgi:hypothetical protein
MPKAIRSAVPVRAVSFVRTGSITAAIGRVETNKLTPPRPRPARWYAGRRVS